MKETIIYNEAPEVRAIRNAGLRGGKAAARAERAAAARILFAALFVLVAGSCYRDRGNYDYSDINEITIGARGFEGVNYRLRSGVDVLRINPDVRASLDPDFRGSYEYEWVATGQVRNPGVRTVLARTRDLEYAVELPSDEYVLSLRITDPATGLMFSRRTELSVSTAYTRGWLVATEDAAGRAVVDMVSISRDTLFQRNVIHGDEPHLGPQQIWCDNNEYTAQVHGRVYLSTAEGSFLYDRETLSTDDYTVMRNYFADPSHLTQAIASDMIQIDDKLRVFLVDGFAYVYSISSANTGYFGNPVNRYAGSYDYAALGDKLAYNLSGGAGAGAITTVMLYNDRDKRFCYLTRSDLTMSNATDTESDIALYTWVTGFDYVTTVNSRFLAGQSATLLHDPQTGEYWIYTYACLRSGPSKGARYRVDGAVPVAGARNWCMTSQHGYLLYTVGSELYGYDFRNGRAPVRLMDCGSDEITLLHNDIHSSVDANADCLYLCTYTPGSDTGGRMRKYYVADTADRIELRPEETTDWTGFGRIRALWFKEL